MEALELMAEKDIGAVPVVKDGELVGIFSERDYARQAVRQRETLNLLPVSTFMTSDVITVTPTQTAKDCMILMTARRITGIYRSSKMTVWLGLSRLAMW